MSRDISQTPTGAQHPLGRCPHLLVSFQAMEMKLVSQVGITRAFESFGFMLRKSKAVFALPLTLK